jgi:hypothetical protein
LRRSINRGALFTASTKVTLLMCIAHVIRYASRFRFSTFAAAYHPTGLSVFACLVAALLAQIPSAWAGAVTVSTYHNDVARTGWNQGETALTPSTVAGATFKKLATIAVDDQVDAEPLYVAGQRIGGATHDTIYVVTESNSIYAIDAATGKVLNARNLGPPVPLSAIPGGCPNNVNAVGINSTPVIDMTSHTLYTITFNYGTKTPVYWIHALDLATLADKVPRVQIQASATLSNGKTFEFSSATSRQRAGLLLKNGNVYAAFTSFCDNIPSVTRGWVLGWKAGTLQPIANALTNKAATSPQNYFLSTIWMSGYGLAADGYGSILFVTGNSDPKNTTYYPNNFAESVVKMGPDLTVQSYFTPGTAATGRAALDKIDNDFGAGGVMVIPAQPGEFPRLAVAAGKVGKMYLMNERSLGGYTNGADNVLQTVDIGACFCGPSYFQGSDGIGRVVSSGGQQVEVWKIITAANAAPKLVLESTSAAITSGQDSGFFTSISSNASTAKSQVIWALSRPSRQNPAAIELYAFDPSTIKAGASKTLFTGAAGVWPNADGNANLVPLVANGHVVVASYKQVSLFGLAPPGAKVRTAEPETAAAETEQGPSLPGHAVYGKLMKVDNAALTLETRTGTLTIDSAPARKAETSALPVVGRAYLARGEYDKGGVLHAVAISRVKDDPELWKADR